MTTEGVKRDALLALEKRVAEAKEGSRELNRLLFDVTHDVEWKPYYPRARKLWAYDRKTGETVAYGDDSIPKYTSSIDAALALVFRTLTPLGFLSWGIDGTQKDYNVGWVAVNVDGGLLEGRGEHKTPALALILALLRSLTKGAGG